MSTDPIQYDLDALIPEVERRLGRRLTPYEQQHIRTVVPEEAGQYNPNATFGTNFGTAIERFFYQAIAWIQEVLGRGMSGGFEFANMQTSVGNSFGASDERTRLWQVTQTAHRTYNRLLPLGEDIASLVSGNTINGEPPLEHSLYYQGVQGIAASREVRELGPRLNLAAQGPQPPVERSNQYQFADADASQNVAPGASPAKSSSYSLTA